MIGELGGDGVVYELEEAAVLLATGGDGGPHSLVVTLVNVAACTLRDAAVDDTVAYLLLGMIVRHEKKRFFIYI